MSLKQNGRLMNQLPLRFRGGALLSFEYQETNKSQLRNIYANDVIDPVNGVASGHLPPSTWLISQKSGGISCFVGISGIGSLSALGAEGVNGGSSVSGSSSFISSGELIVSGQSDILAGSTFTGNVVAVLLGAASVTSSGGMTGGLSAKGYALCQLVGGGGMIALPLAAGSMSATITLTTELSPSNLSEAVWNYLKTNPTISGSMKEELQKAKIAAENSFAVSS